MTTIEHPLGLADLREQVAGTVVEDGDARWDDAREAYNLVVDQRPAAVVLPENAGDVRRVVRWAAASGLRVAPQRTGHNAEPLGDLAGTILLRTDAMRDVDIDAERRIARVGAGAKWADVVPRASELGLAALHGSTPDVSIAGYGLGGGLGWYGRKHGLFTNSITAIELVTAEGRLRRVDAENDPELFWALRGGGGSFGVVTALEFRLLAVDEVYAGHLFFPYERAAEVLGAWLEWTKTVPEELTSVGRILHFPPFEDVPEPFRGQSFAFVEAFFLGTEAEGRALLEPLRALGPSIDTMAMVPPVGLSEIHMDPPDPMPFASGHLLLERIDAATLRRVVEAVPPGDPVMMLELRHLGGALGRGGEGHGALASLAGDFIAFGGGIVAGPVTSEAVTNQLEHVLAPLEPHRTGRYLNFEESPVEPGAFWDADTFARLQAVKARVDPGDLFRSNHPVRAAG